MTGSLQVKNGKYYAVVNYQDQDGKRKQKWINTGLTEKGNKKAASKTLRDILNEYEDKKVCIGKDMIFADYVEHWLKNLKMCEGTDEGVDPITYQGYEQYVKKHISPYFKSLGLKVSEITPQILDKYRNDKLESGRLDGKGGLSPKSVKLYFIVIHLVLKKALKDRLIAYDPSIGVAMPKLDKFKGKFYSSQEVEQLLKACTAEPLKPLITFTVYYGLRRSEALGIKWDAVDFKNNTIEIKSTVVKCTQTVKKDKTKNESSHRFYPLLPEFKKVLQDLKKSQAEKRLLLGKAYTVSDYVFCWDDGRPFSPDYVSQRFQSILKKHDLRKIRFHDLRHSCASVLISMGYNLKDIQEWLGHADIKTTANIYGHMDMSRKNSLAETLVKSIKVC